MKRLHIHVSVADLDRSAQFYAALFGAEPTVRKDDYAKWLLDDPSVNFAISSHEGRTPGIDHIGIQTDSREGLDDITAKLKAAGETTVDLEATACCYAVSDKTWVADPAGIRWETFFTHGESTDYGADASRAAMTAPQAGDCCDAR